MGKSHKLHTNERRINKLRRQLKIEPQTQDDGVDEIDMTQEAETARHEFFAMLIGAKLVGHILHLQTDCFAKHIALDEFYKGAQKVADKVIEVYQGAMKHIVHYVPEYLYWGMDSTPVVYLQMLREEIQQRRYEVIPKDITNVHNELDNFITLIDTAVYKITFLE